MEKRVGFEKHVGKFGVRGFSHAMHPGRPVASASMRSRHGIATLIDAMEGVLHMVKSVTGELCGH